jgi:hypothetical protein
MEEKSVMDYTTRYIDKTTINQAVKLIREFTGGSYFGADDKYVQWMYFDSPLKTNIVEKEKYSILAFLNKKGTILALDAFLPWCTYVGGEAVTTIWDIEWINFSKIKGLGRELVKIVRKKAGIYCGYGMNQLSLRAYEKLDYSILDEIERKIAVLDADECIKVLGSPGIAGQKDFFLKSEISQAAISDYCVIDDAGKISEEYWMDHVSRFKITSCKDVRVLKWRYFGHPYIKYKIISLDPMARKGLAVVRVEKIKRSQAIVLRVLELMPVMGYEKDLAHAVLGFGSDEGAILADFFCVSRQYCSEICPKPFIPLSEYRSYDVPTLFQPVEVRERKSINMVLDCSEQYKTVSFDDFYATKGDGDQDVFVNEDYRTVSL